MTDLEFENVALMHDAVAEHVRATGHDRYTLDDTIAAKTVGVCCEVCALRWNAPHPGGLMSRWNGRMKEMVEVYRTLEGRRKFLARQVSEGRTGPSVWDWLRTRTGVGW